MADVIEIIQPGVTIEIVRPGATVIIANDVPVASVDILHTASTIVGIASAIGPSGAQGSPGPTGPPGATGGGNRFYGEGPPGVVIGAVLGDEYVDITTGDLYRMD